MLDQRLRCILLCLICTGYRDFVSGQQISCNNFDSWNSTLVQALIRIAEQRAMRDQCDPRDFWQSNKTIFTRLCVIHITLSPDVTHALSVVPIYPLPSRALWIHRPPWVIHCLRSNMLFDRTFWRVSGAQPGCSPAKVVKRESDLRRARTQPPPFVGHRAATRLSNASNTILSTKWWHSSLGGDFFARMQSLTRRSYLWNYPPSVTKNCHPAQSIISRY